MKQAVSGIASVLVVGAAVFFFAMFKDNQRKEAEAKARQESAERVRQRIQPTIDGMNQAKKRLAEMRSKPLSREDVERMLKDPNTSESTRQSLELMKRANGW